MDCSVQPTKVPGVSLVTTTDFFYPLVECPYVQGLSVVKLGQNAQRITSAGRVGRAPFSIAHDD